MTRGSDPHEKVKNRGVSGDAARHLALSLVLGASILTVAEAAPLDSASIVSPCVTVGAGGAPVCPAVAGGQPVAPMRQPGRPAPILWEPRGAILPAVLVRPGAREPQPRPVVPADPAPQTGQNPPALQPDPGPDPARLHRAQSAARGVMKAAGLGADRLEDALSRIRPEPWRNGYDASGWQLTAERLAGWTSFGGPDQPVPLVSHYPAGLPGQVLRLRWNAGFDGARPSDFAMPGLLAARVLVARYYHGRVFRVSTNLGAVLLPMPEPRIDSAALRFLFPVPSASRARSLAPEGEAPVPAPVPVPPTAFLILLPLAGLALAGRRLRPKRADSARLQRCRDGF